MPRDARNAAIISGGEYLAERKFALSPDHCVDVAGSQHLLGEERGLLTADEDDQIPPALLERLGKRQCILGVRSTVDAETEDIRAQSQQLFSMVVDVVPLAAHVDQRYVGMSLGMGRERLDA
jgi:hypothetical protein